MKPVCKSVGWGTNAKLFSPRQQTTFCLYFSSFQNKKKLYPPPWLKLLRKRVWWLTDRKRVHSGGIRFFARNRICPSAPSLVQTRSNICFWCPLLLEVDYHQGTLHHHPAGSAGRTSKHVHHNAASSSATSSINLPLDYPLVFLIISSVFHFSSLTCTY